MTATPKSVIMAVVVIIGAVVLAVVAADAALIATGNPTLPSQIETLAPVGLAGVIGLLASTRTTPELPPGTTLHGAVLENNADTAKRAIPVSFDEPAGTVLHGVAPLPNAGPVDANLIPRYETGPADRPSDAALTADTMGTPPEA